jgi:LCP family protein required for cell wall assembly
MDGIKKPTLSAPMKEEAPIIYEPPTTYFPKKEELYIPREESMQVEKDETRFQKGRLIRKIFWTFSVLVLLSLLLIGIFFLWKTYTTTKKMNVSSAQSTLSQDMKSMLSPILPGEKYQLQGEAGGRVNILLLGAAGENKPGGNLTDTVMMMSIDTKNQKVALLSLPRDFYVPIGESNSFTKINGLYKIGLTQQKGIDLIKQAVEKVTGVTINYHVVVNFDAFAKIVDDINGVNVMVQRDIYDATYPGPNYSYETFALTKGAHLLDGNTALKYVRERHDDPEGDFGRAKRQQQVIQAVKSRMFSMQTLFNVKALSNVLDTLGGNIKTDMTFDDIEKFIKLSKIVDTQNITNVVVDAWKPESLLKVSHVMIGNDRAFILVPRVGNYSEIKDLAQNIFDQNELKKRHASILEENASIAIINESGDSGLANKIKKLLTENLAMKNVRVLPSSNSETRENTIISSDSDNAKIFTLDELIKKLPASLADGQETVDSVPATSADNMTITLGKDLSTVYKYEEDTMQDLQNADDSQINF